MSVRLTLRKKTPPPWLSAELSLMVHAMRFKDRRLESPVEFWKERPPPWFLLSFPLMVQAFRVELEVDEIED